MLGVSREKTQYQVRTSFDEETQSMFARNYFDADFAQNVAFASISERVAYYTADRREFLGRNGTISSPAALERAGLSGAIGATDRSVLRDAGEHSHRAGRDRDIVMLLGAAEGEDARAGRSSARIARRRRRNSRSTPTPRRWERRLATIKVRTPEPTFDLMVNRWALYQALSCRMWARTALYQSSGAFGFRDQLQDVMAFVVCRAASGAESTSFALHRVSSWKATCSTGGIRRAGAGRAHAVLGRSRLASVRRSTTT